MTLAELYRRRHELLFKKEYARAPIYAKVVTHRITPALVWFFEKLGVTPNQTTGLSLVVGVAAAALFSRPEVYWTLAAALTLEFYYILDSVDGQLARWTKNFSKTGSFLDLMGNYIVHPLVYSALGVSQQAAGHGAAAVWLGIGAALGSLWLGIPWDVRGHVVYFSLRKENAAKRFEAAQPSSTAPSTVSPLGRVFSIIHKACTYPHAMNLLTGASVVQWLWPELNCIWPLLLFWGIGLPVVSLLKIAKVIRARDVDREYDSWRAV